ncbi:MAG: hypothetical protein KGH63_01650 [Candidatus Micrarchaeota archaeon]|nr:hypothetical protein [Candidatus Micrarchaeota archaeon]
MSKSVSNKTGGSASNLVRLWLRQKPFMHWLVREGLVNYTALAQRLEKEGFAAGKRPVAALRAALLRSRGLEMGEFDPFGRNDVLRGSQFEIRSDVTVLQSAHALDIPVIAISSSKNSVTSIVDAQAAKRAPRGAKVVGSKMVLVTIYSGEEIENEPGVLATMLMHLALQRVNVLEVTSCGPDTLLVIEPKDLSTTLSVLQGLMAPEKKSGGAKALFSYAKVEKEGGRGRE